MLQPDNKTFLNWISAQKGPNQSKLDLSLVSHIIFGHKSTPKLQTLHMELKGRRHLALAIMSEQGSPLEVVFENADGMAFFVTGL